uniref:Uncharacterized protein n=1 Tax=Moniliophthora roreri TaxID=221103 RepID=A0A0W0GCR2_MONRR
MALLSELAASINRLSSGLPRQPSFTRPSSLFRLPSLLSLSHMLKCNAQLGVYHCHIVPLQPQPNEFFYNYRHCAEREYEFWTAITSGMVSS